jgi:hypothetical protein
MVREASWVRGGVTPVFANNTWSAGGFQFLEGITIQRVIAGFALVMRWSGSIGVGFNGPGSITFGLRLTPVSVSTPTDGPETNPTDDWMGVWRIPPVYMQIPATPGQTNYIEEWWTPGVEQLDVAGQRRVGAGGRRLWLSGQLAGGQVWPVPGGSSSGAYLSVLALGV